MVVFALYYHVEYVVQMDGTTTRVFLLGVLAEAEAILSSLLYFLSFNQ